MIHLVSWPLHWDQFFPGMYGDYYGKPCLAISALWMPTVGVTSAHWATRLNVDRIGVVGEYGTFNSSPRDGVILREYAIKKKCAGSTNDHDLIRSFFVDDFDMAQTSE